MTHALNFTLPIQQDAETQAKLRRLKETFAEEVQPAIERVLKQPPRIVHFARVLVIDDKYFQLITTYEGGHGDYTEHFRRQLTPVFAKIFELAEGAPDVNDRAAFLEFAAKHNVQSLGRAVDGAKSLDGRPAGWLFSAYGHKNVKTILAAIGED